MSRTKPQGYLKLVSGRDSQVSSPSYPLFKYEELIVGRDPSCQIPLDAHQYTMVSRKHAALHFRDPSTGWEIRDLGSANGTYVNRNLVRGYRPLSPGDRIMLGTNGPVMELELPPEPNQVSSSASAPTQSVTITQLFPIVSTGRELASKAYLIPASFTALVAVLLFFLRVPELFNLVLGGYLAAIAYTYIYQLCGKHKPWWLLLGSTLWTLLLAIPLVQLLAPIFYGGLAGWATGDQFFPTLVRQTLGTGLLEELIKAIPIFLILLWGKVRFFSPRQTWGVREPLDGILIGSASAVGFTLIETLGLYVPSQIESITAISSLDTGQLAGLQLLIPRLLGSVSGHLAYSGYFGYFIGLGILKPKQRWPILAVGYGSASLLHGLWNTTGTVVASQVSLFAGLISLACIGVLSYAFLAAAILKARALSPTRSQNFATRIN
ncbi:PrsW family glutamic-type intramembrane protease [Roseofilum casamattae]|uniref:PrsW family glutamic-type intramembrane protease n=1 Tax=Roseofilum casamattae BLCC-M143 TaxID=3022442 RepID=A0ABT7BW04_9CYAN|nr:PrsW family glutamic-type intramembrane protease [Roseofilum casamattae]MDJ1183369.1 PrsW family glutamic-type intramembrane protease [Roseofilum casamattae BLCC-M143]